MHVSKLRLDNMKSIVGSGLCHLHSLVELGLIFCHTKIGDYLYHLPYLLGLSIQSYFGSLTQVRQLYQLQRLIIEDCHNIRDSDICLSNLHTLSVISCKRITIYGVQQIPNLTTVNFYKFNQNDQKVIDQLKTAKRRKVTTFSRPHNLPRTFIDKLISCTTF
jgi:hypothetical protein